MKPGTFGRAGAAAALALGLSTGWPVPAAAVVVHNNVNTAAKFQLALTQAENNNDDDVIHLTAGVFKIANNGNLPFTYVADPAEAHSLTIVGVDAQQTVLDGGLIDQILHIDTTPVVGDIDTTVTVSGVTFFHGNVTGGGGGLLVHTTNADVVLSSCLFDRNEAANGGPDPLDGEGGGAGLSSDAGGNFLVVGNFFLANQADDAGGGLATLSLSGDATVRGNRFHGNTADAGGGLVLIPFTGNVDFFNNIVDQNSANLEGGGLVVLANGHLNVLQNDFFDNFGPLGGGLAIAGDAGVFDLYNNIFSENGAGSGKDVYVDDSTPLETHLFNNIFSEYCDKASAGCDPAFLGENQADNLIDADPLFADPANGDFHLKPGSPAINAGTADAPSLPDKDMEANPRIDGPAPDMGALETIGACGNGTVETGEECDNGADNNDTTPDACRTTCVNAKCGDGVIDTGEVCDDGNTDGGDGCSASCQEETTGEGTAGTTGGDTAGSTGGTSGGGTGDGGGGCSLIR